APPRKSGAAARRTLSGERAARKPPILNRWTGLLAVDPVQHFLPVEAVAEVGTAADCVQTERSHPDDQVGRRLAEKHRPAGIARARAATPIAVALQLQIEPVGVVAPEIDERSFVRWALAIGELVEG